MAAVFVTDHRLDSNVKLTYNNMRREVLSKIKFGQAITTEIGQRVYVAAFYPDHVLCHGAAGATCYTYYELWVMLQHKQDKVNIPGKLRRRGR